MTIDAPRYRHVADRLAQRIADGEFPVGSMLPGEQALAGEHGVARGTVRSALALLARRGAVSSRPGAGWIVQSSAHTQGLAAFGSFAQWAKNRGLTPGGQVIQEQESHATADEARMLRIAQGSFVLRFTRLRSLDGHVVMIERPVYPAWIAAALRGLPVDTPSHAAVLEAAGHGEVFGSHRIDAVAASSEDARLLGVRRSSPLLRVRRQAFARDGRPLDLTEDRYLPDAVSFEASSTSDAQPGGWTRTLS
ncbi:GntR family transcriptional regulator [Microbacterium sp. A93]|uniref:GntR family transcriptional regulator n=1 Tax=Microbacterium sp. A93 TaxID=3450716 RepID=UPI003F44145E